MSSITPSFGSTEVKDGESPLYTSDSSSPPNSPQSAANALPQGSGTSLNANTVQSLLAVTAAVAGPNKLVATDNTGKLPLSIIPVSSGGIVIAATGPYLTLKSSPLTGQYFAWATTIGNGALVFNTNISTIGDSGWFTVFGG